MAKEGKTFSRLEDYEELGKGKEACFNEPVRNFVFEA
jgi:hypothetical protein